MDPYRTHRSTSVSKVKVINGSSSSLRSSRNIEHRSCDTRSTKDKHQSTLWQMNTISQLSNGFNSPSSSSNSSNLSTFGFTNSGGRANGFGGDPAFASTAAGHYRMSTHRNIDHEEAMDIDHQVDMEVPTSAASHPKMHTTSYNDTSPATWKVLNASKLNLPSSSPKESKKPTDNASDSSRDAHSSTADAINASPRHVAAKNSKGPLKKKAIYIVLHVSDVMIGHLSAKASAPIKIYAEKLFLEIEFKDSSALSLRLPCTDFSHCSVCFEAPKPVIVLTLTKQGVKLINDKKKEILIDPNKTDGGMDKVVLYLNHGKSGVPQSTKDDFRELFQRRLSSGIQWNEISPSEIAKLLCPEEQPSVKSDSKSCDSSKSPSDQEQQSAATEAPSGRKILTPKKSRSTARKTLFESETAPGSSNAQQDAECKKSSNTTTETTKEKTGQDKIVTRSRRRKAEAEAAEPSSPPKTIQTCDEIATSSTSTVDSQETNEKEKKYRENVPQERDILQHHSKMESHISLLGKHSEEQRNTLEHHQKLLTLERAERNRSFERIQELQSTQRENHIRLIEKEESIALLEREVESQKVTVRQLQQELTQERESSSLMRKVQSDLVLVRREFDEEKVVRGIRDKQLQDKQTELEETRRLCSEEGNARRRLEEELQRMRNACVQHMDELENQRLFRQTQEHELQGREDRLQASEQRYQDERSTRLNLEDQLRRLRLENDELRCSRESTENELVQERRRRREESESFAQERLTYQQRIRESVSSLADSERRIQELQTTVNNSQSILDDHRRIEPRDWIIRREEVTFTDVSLGNGAWGTVKVGIFRSSKVAVKQIHELILSPHNRRLFEREMSIAARCRHPCLLQFIGATNDDGVPLFITELLDVDLRAVLSRRSLHQEEIITIALDVARALNYLHLSRPYPIIHRDISSSNVLLWKRDTCWRAKLSDYGAANFMRQYMTVNPGAGIYAAPEASTSQQSPKVDIYSFGLLLCELCIRELPVPQQTQEQITLVSNGMLRELIIRCVRVDPETRPTMADIITLLEQQQVHLLEHGVVSINGRSASL